MKGITYLFLPYNDDDKYAISLKKIKKEIAWAVIKNLLEFDFYSNPGEHTICLNCGHRTNILEKLKKWIREGDHRKIGISFEEF